jgi:uncharacterized protein (TIGR02996 family)
MTPEQGFLQDIRDNPDDDAPRLVCADWYDENDQPERAEFIRIQCRLARTPHALGNPALRRREVELLKTHGKQWRAPLKKFSNKVGFSRGFADHMLLNGLTFLEHAEELFRLAPVSHIKFRLRSDNRELLPRIAACPSLAGLTTVDFQANKLGGERLEGFFHSPHLTRLKHLKLNNNGLGNKGTVLLARSPLLGQLLSLDLTGNEIGPEGVEALVASPAFAGLRALDLTRNLRVHGAGIQALASSPHVGNLETLGLREFTMLGRPQGQMVVDIEALASSRHLRNLATLDLANNNGLVRDDSLLPLATTGNLPRLRHLCLTCCDIRLGTDSGAFGWLESNFLDRLETLDLDHCPLDEASIRALVRLPPLARLRSLRLSTYNTHLWKSELPGLNEARCLDGLTSLHLGHNLGGDAGARVLAANPRLRNLQVLDLDDSAIGEVGARALLESPHLADAVVYLVRNRLDTPARRALQGQYDDRLELESRSEGATGEW